MEIYDISANDVETSGPNFHLYTVSNYTTLRHFSVSDNILTTRGSTQTSESYLTLQRGCMFFTTISHVYILQFFNCYPNNYHVVYIEAYIFFMLIAQRVELNCHPSDLSHFHPSRGL